MAKPYLTRLTETVQFITTFGNNNPGFSVNAQWVVAQLQTWLGDNAKVAEHQQVSALMSQEGSTNRPGVFKGDLRKYRRAQILIQVVLLGELQQPTKTKVENIVHTNLKTELGMDLNDARRRGNPFVPDTQRPDNYTYRPLKIGGSISNYPDNGPGTISCFVRDRANGDVMLLTNLHVAQNSMPAGGGFVRPNTQLNPQDFPGASVNIIQKSGMGGGNLSYKVAEFTRGFLRGAPVGLDCAACKLEPGIGYVNQTPEGAVLINNPIPAAVGMLVWKRGCASGIEYGQITQINVAANSAFNPKFGGGIQMQGQIEVTGNTNFFQIPGDSGSLLIDQTTNRPVGLLHGGGAQMGLATPIDDVLNALNVDVI